MQNKLWLLIDALLSVWSSLKGSGLLPQYGDHAQRREAPQRDDRPPDEKGTAHMDHIRPSITDITNKYFFFTLSFINVGQPADANTENIFVSLIGAQFPNLCHGSDFRWGVVNTRSLLGYCWLGIAHQD